MNFLRLNTTDPYYNLAVEEYLFLHATDDLFMLWQNEPTVVIGKNQNAYAEINMDAVEKRGIHIARRITGGGAVYHDLGNLNYTFISAARGTSLDFAYFTAPVIEALACVGICAELSGRNDLVTDGKKFSGNAQYSANGKTLHHGTLLFDSDLEMLSSVLRVDEEKLRTKAIRSVHARVTNLKPLVSEISDTEVLSALLSQYVMQAYKPTVIAPPVCPEVEALCRRNASAEWLYPERELIARYSVVRKRRYPFGGVEIFMEMSNKTVQDVRICGDFFSNNPIEELEALIRGKTLDMLEKTLLFIDADAYICGMTGEMLVSQILTDGT
ncbi:MAG: lipoate--protein ligase [Clostridia bacterium]|nr:lipoate--protein ligase [Clostridia bacterium]